MQSSPCGFLVWIINITVVLFGNLEGAVRRGWGGKEKEWNRLHPERHPGVWHSVRLESDGLKG